ncbi:MAG: DUF2306 domain-containing protein [Pseudomonadota bacterium]
MKTLHIVTGLLALLAGAIALYAAKGNRWHRQAGTVFVYAMLLMSASGAIMAALQPQRTSVVAGALAFYLVLSAWLTVRGPTPRWLDRTLALTGAGIGCAGISIGVITMNQPRGLLDGLPAAPAFMFGVVALIAAVFDVRKLRYGVVGGQRMTRHLWRMCLALMLAAASFFLGQARLFPAPLNHPLLLASPVILVLLVMLFWLIRIRFFPAHGRINSRQGMR